MAFIPHTEQDIQAMLQAIGIHSTADLFDEIPDSLKISGLAKVPEALNEMSLMRLLKTRAAQDSGLQCFVGAGAYEHHIPAAVWDVAARGEWMTAYTPYQAEASQGTLQLLYEYQTMMTRLTGMEVSNASLYDGATALAEAVLMAIRANKPNHTKTVLMPRSVNPAYRAVVKTIVSRQDVNVIDIDYDHQTGCVDLQALKNHNFPAFSALVIPQPNFFGVLEDMDGLTDWAHAQKALVIAVVNPTSLALLKPPGAWGETGADIACGEGQPLGIPLASGGPYFGFITAKSVYVRQMPGRIIGRTTDVEGKQGFTLTLQAREQHIRRAKATSNICTNQGLMVTAATIYMSILGAQGLSNIAKVSHANARRLKQALTVIPGVKSVFDKPYFHEFVIHCPKSVDHILEKMTAAGFLAGFALEQHYPELKNSLLICTTETKTIEDLNAYVNAFKAAVESI